MLLFSSISTKEFIEAIPVLSYYFQQGDENLIPQDKYLLWKHAADSLYEYRINTKQSWLDCIINSAREAFTMAEPISPTTTQQSLRNYFTT